MSTEQMQQEFESEYLLRWSNGWPAETLFQRGHSRDYLMDAVQNAWEIWQASRATLVVQLPETFDATHHPLHGEYPCLDPEEVKAALAAVGLKVKP